MNSKGFFVLKKFIKKHSVNDIAFIVSERDVNIVNDYYDEIRNLAFDNNIKFYNRKQLDLTADYNVQCYAFAIGWRWLIHNQENLIVFHDSLLPKYRGFSPLVNALINKEPQIGVTALYAAKDYDAGDIISQKSIKITYPITVKEVIEQIQPLYFALVDTIFYDIKNNIKISSNSQSNFEATFSLWLDEQDYFIDWAWSADKIKRFIDSVGSPYGKARAYLRGKIILFKKADVFEDVVVEHRDRHIGKVIFYKSGYPVIVCSDGLLHLIELTDEYDHPIKIKFRSRFR